MKVITLNPQELINSSRKLAHKVLSNGWYPDLIIGIKTGGLYVAEPLYDEISLQHKTLYNTISLSRPSTVKKKKFKVGKLLKLLPYSILNILRNLEVSFFELKKASQYEPTREKEVYFNEELLHQINVSNQILLVDDAIDTGTTILAIKNRLLSLNPALQIKVAILTTTHKSTYITADYSLYERVLLRCPWSEDYKEDKNV